MNLDTGDTKYVKQLYDASVQLVDAKAQITANSNSIAIKQLNDLFTKMTDDISITTDFNTLKDNDINMMLSEWRGWTDTSVNKYQTSCATGTKDA
jgi:hypothetical protein